MILTASVGGREGGILIRNRRGEKRGRDGGGERDGGEGEKEGGMGERGYTTNRFPELGGVQ